MVKLKLRSGSGTTTAHGRNVTRYISHCGEMVKWTRGGKGAARWCPIRIRAVRAVRQWLGPDPGYECACRTGTRLGVAKAGLNSGVGRWSG
jgi:hypothetical protein